MPGHIKTVTLGLCPDLPTVVTLGQGKGAEVAQTAPWKRRAPTWGSSIRTPHLPVWVHIRKCPRSFSFVAATSTWNHAHTKRTHPHWRHVTCLTAGRGQRHRVLSVVGSAADQSFIGRPLSKVKGCYCVQVLDSWTHKHINWAKNGRECSRFRWLQNLVNIPKINELKL